MRWFLTGPLARGKAAEKRAPMVSTVLVVAGVGLASAGCEGQKFDYDGETIFERFPLEGERMWKYINEDPNVGYTLTVEKTNEQLVNGKSIVTLTHTATDIDGNETIIDAIDWSAHEDDGIEIHSWTDYRDDPAGVTVTYSPPIRFAERQMNSGDIVETSTGGATYTGEYSGLQDCPNNWSQSTWECARITLSSTIAGESFTGEYWIAMSYGTSWMAPTEVGGKWVLADALFGVDGE